MDGRTSRGISNVRALSVVGLALAGSLPAARGEATGKTVLDTPAGPMVLATTVPVGPVHAGPAHGGVAGTSAPTASAAAPVTPATAVTPESATGATAGVPKAASAETPAVATQPADPAATAAAKTAEPAPAAPGSALGQTAIRARTESAPSEAAASKPPQSALVSGLYSALQVGGALAVVIGLIIIGRAMMRRFVPGAAVGTGKGVIETLARYPIGRNQSVVLIRIGSQIVAMNQTKDASQSILVISEPVEVAKIIGQIEGQDSNSIQTNFNRALANARMDLEAPDTMDVLEANRSVSVQGEDDLDTQLEEMAAAKRQLMELRAQVRSVRDNLPA